MEPAAKPSVVGCIVWVSIVFWVLACIIIAFAEPDIFISLIAGIVGVLFMIGVAWVMGVLK